MIIQRFNFLWFVLAGWVISLFTLRTNGWYFLFKNNNKYGALFAITLAIILALAGFFISVSKVSNQLQKREVLVHVITWMLALPLIGLSVTQIYFIQNGID